MIILVVKFPKQLLVPSAEALQAQTLTIQLGSAAQLANKWSKRGSFTVNLEPNSQADLQIAINSAALSK